MSFDVISMYTNIPKHLVLKNIKRRWEQIHKNIQLEEFLTAISIILDSMFFKFNDTIFKVKNIKKPIKAYISCSDAQKILYFRVNVTKRIKYMF